jgi:hypothetical protein
MKIERFLICKNPLVKEGATYILCTRPIVLFNTDFEIIIGEADEGLINRAKDWYKSVQLKEK